MDGLEFNIDRHGGSEKVLKDGVPAEMITPGFCIQRSLLSHAQDEEHEVLFRDPSSSSSTRRAPLLRQVRPPLKSACP